MHYLFFDESYPRNDPESIITASWIVERMKFDRQFHLSPDLHRTQLNSIIESVDGWAVVAAANLDSKLFRAGEIDGTDDIPCMARRDNIWSQCFVFTIANLLAKVAHEGNDVEVLDIYHDPKDLKPQHYIAVENTLREMIVPMTKQFGRFVQRSNTSTYLMRKLEIHRIEAVAKACNGEPLNKFQNGIRVADRLCSTSNAFRARNFSRILIADLSKVVRRTTQPFK